MALKAMTAQDALQDFIGAVERAHLDAPWTGEVLSHSPRTRVLPFLWRWADVEPLLMRAGELVTPDRGVERRILRLANPGVPGKTSTHTLSTAVQLLLPGECAPAHRHSPTAIRFIMQGHGAYTTVEGEQCPMEPGDLVLTPSWTWHDHGSESSGPVIWMDGLDVPLIRSLETMFYEPFPDDRQPVSKATGDSVRRYGAGGLKPVWGKLRSDLPPLVHYKWEQTHAALQRLAELDASPFDDVAMEYTNTATGGSALRTIACWIQLIRPGVRTQAHRQTSSAVYHVFAGHGFSIIAGQRFDWRKGDFFSIPPWAWHEHANEEGEEAVLFSIQDTPVFEALGLYREEAYAEHGGHQSITGVFDG
ncbi:MAG: cupin domain-containing protein [Nitrospinae bacterium]|nr:cupin domain-containing protein [Nitrospinota bacterium]